MELTSSSGCVARLVSIFAVSLVSEVSYAQTQHITTIACRQPFTMPSSSPSCFLPMLNFSINVAPAPNAHPAMNGMVLFDEGTAAIAGSATVLLLPS